MKFFYSLPVLAALVSLPSAGLAQSDAVARTMLAANLDSIPSPAVFAVVDRPAPAFSSSNAPALFSEDRQSSTFPTQTAPAAKPAEGHGARPFSGVAAGVTLGLAGIGFDVATPLVRRHLNLRGGAAFFNYNTTFTVDSLNIVGALKFQSAKAVVDWFPFRGAFRISGGMTFANQTAFNATLVPTAGQSFSVNSVNYYSYPTNPITGTGVFTFGGSTAPRITLGWGNMLKEKGHIGFQTEFGAEFISTPTVVYAISGTGCQNYNGGAVGSDSSYSNCGPIPASNVAAQQASIQSDLNPYRFFPILSIGLSYRLFLTH